MFYKKDRLFFKSVLKHPTIFYHMKCYVVHRLGR